jgi:hypothetical protein
MSRREKVLKGLLDSFCDGISIKGPKHVFPSALTHWLKNVWRADNLADGLGK